MISWPTIQHCYPVIQHCDEYNTCVTILLNIHSFYLFLQSEEHSSGKCLALLGQGQSIYTYHCMLLVHHKLSTEIHWMFTYRNSIPLENSNCKFFCYCCYGWKKNQHWSNSTRSNIPVWLVSYGYPCRTATLLIRTSVSAHFSCKMILPSASSVQNCH